MKPTKRAVLLVVLFAILGFLLQPQAPLGNLLWPPHDLEAVYGPASPGTVAALMAYSVVASLAFGLAAAFLVEGGALVQRLPVSPGLGRAAHLAIVWLLGSWVPHDSLHQHIVSMSALAGLEWGFHFTLIACGVILASLVITAATASVPVARAAVPVPAVSPVLRNSE